MNFIRSLSLQIKILLIVGAACLLCAGVAIGGFVHFNEKALEYGIINKEKTIHTQLAAATEFVAKQGGLNGVIRKLTDKYKSAEQLSDDEKSQVLNQVPIYASLIIGKKNAEIDHYKFRVFSDEPRRKENLATSKELEILKKFAEDKSLNEYIENDGQNITTFKPIRLSENQGCLTCHGDPSTSPWHNETDILGHKMENWKDGKLHGVFAIGQNKTEVELSSNAGSRISPAGWLIGAIMLGAGIAIIFAGLIMRAPISALNQIAAAISQVCSNVNTHSEEVAKSSQKLSQASTEQAASLEETAASLEQISAMVAKASDGASSAAKSSTESQQKAEEGRTAVEQMLTSMNEISQSNEDIVSQVNFSHQKMTEIVNVIQEIGNKTKIINEIVFQTKLLSFNAAVEAARAGEHGKGFAVVADEVGSLAQMSGNAAKEITDMLEGSISKVETMVHDTKTQVETLVQKGRMKVESGVNVARQCSIVLNDIVNNVNRVSSLAQEISHAGQEQAQGVFEINKAMSQLDAVTQQNASTSEETAGAAEELSSQAESLRVAVDQLISTVQGAGQKQQTRTTTNNEKSNLLFKNKIDKSQLSI